MSSGPKGGPGRFTWVTALSAYRTGDLRVRSGAFGEVGLRETKSAADPKWIDGRKRSPRSGPQLLPSSHATTVLIADVEGGGGSCWVLVEFEPRGKCM